MKNLIIAGAFAVSSAAAVAEPFEFQKQFGGPENNIHEEGTEGMTFAPVVESGNVPSLTAWMQSANVDGIAPNDFEGRIIESGPSRISLYEMQRDSPEGIAYSGYHERYPADTDWDQVARDFRKHEGLASGTGMDEGDS